MLDFKPRLAGGESIITSLATAALVIGVYQATVGPVSDVHATDANDINFRAATRKAGWLALGVVSAVAILSHDMNIVILGGAAIIAEEVCYRHALSVNPHTGAITLTPAAYTTVSNGAPAVTATAG